MAEGKIRRLTFEFEDTVVIFEGAEGKRMWEIIEGFVAKLDLDKANYGGETIVPLPTYIYDKRDKKDFPK